MEELNRLYALGRCKSLPDKDRMVFLKKKECWTDDHAALQAKIETVFPGTHVVSRPEEFNDCLETIAKGSVSIVRDDLIILKKGEDDQCHRNALGLLARGEVDYLCTGYALSDDGLWRHHSWGSNLDGYIIETTTPRLVYYGFIDLSAEEFQERVVDAAKGFSTAQLK